MAQPFRLYNTLSRNVEDFKPYNEGRVNLYVCGMTVYDHSHVGHARAMVVFDVVARYLRHREWDVNFVRNYTDVDDKIIDRANKLGEDPLALSKRFIKVFEEDMEALGLKRPDHEPRVSECIEEIQTLIAKLIERGHAYEAEGSVWFSVSSCPEYGKLSGQRPDEMQNSADSADGKKNPRDFVLWKAKKPGEPAWPSPWGEGRPGWHIECSAMAHKHLDVQVDIHGGGLDLVFPHHENEVAQSECGHSHKPYARYWMHNGLLTMTGGQKMGKSLGNVVNIRDALKEFPAEALRLYYLQVHYRSPLPWNAEALPEALALLSRLYEAREVAEEMGGEEPVDTVAKDLGEEARSVVELGRAFRAKFYAAMDDDFNTAKALGYAFELARAVNRFSGHKKSKKRGGPVAKVALEALRTVTDALGLMAMSSDAFAAEVRQKRLPTMGLTEADVEGKLTERKQAREAKDWVRADEIRDELDKLGILVMDRPEGVSWRIRL